jgi:hypothetical protein
MIAIAIVRKPGTVKHWVFDARDFPPARTPDLPAYPGQYSGATGDALLAAACGDYQESSLQSGASVKTLTGGQHHSGDV